jgi:glycosyltransferase involved in cell wall biosynthesis
MELNKTRLALVFKDFAAWCQSSTVGLNVAGFATAGVLNANGIQTTVIPVRNNVDMVTGIQLYNSTHLYPLTHVVISAPWLSVFDLRDLLTFFPDIDFAILSHSNVGFLQADPCGVGLIKSYLELTEEFDNLSVGANSDKLFQWLQNTIGGDTVLLPNLYSLKDHKPEKHWFGADPIKIGAFGAVRPEKNFMTAAAAAVAIQAMTGVGVELHMSIGGEGGGENTISAIAQLCDSPGMTLIQHAWCLWPDFIQIVGDMDLLIQPSYTESFNMITADGILMGVPSVVSSAINWAPDEWKADSDNAMSIARVGFKLLSYGNYGEGKKALEKHNRHALHLWKKYLLGEAQPILGRLFDRMRNSFI